MISKDEYLKNKKIFYLNKGYSHSISEKMSLNDYNYIKDKYDLSEHRKIEKRILGKRN